MTTPARRRPGSASPISLVPAIEEVRTAVSPPVALESTTAQVETPVKVEAATARTTEPAESDTKKAVTFSLRTSLKKRAETAVLTTAAYSGGYTSLAALVDGALERELSRLAGEFNAGEPFPPNGGGFRQGRPLGS